MTSQFLATARDVKCETLGRLREPLSQVFPEQVRLDFTVAIATYNGQYRLPEVLECLRWQINRNKIAWEVIVVDNNSTDDTAQVVRDFQAKWPRPGGLRYASEKRQGAGYARHHAVRIARSPLIGFLDDDNLPSMTWVYAAYKFGLDHPKAGVYGSRIRGDFEINPPQHFERISAFLALTERGNKPRIYDPAQKILPPSAGLVVRRQAWLENVPEDQVLIGRAGQSMLGGEDLEAVLHVQRAGWEVWYNAAMRLYHKIPARRLKRDYLISLFRGAGLSRHQTRMLSVSAWQRPMMMVAYMANDIRKIGRHLIRHRHKAFTDVVAACEITLYFYSLISPFFLWQRGIRRALQSQSGLSKHQIAES
ncbi:MAG: hormogonium polysaccharide biosynthesis glycosyltransferase HpsE [Cyanobacteria bacterium J06639_16]